MYTYHEEGFDVKLIPIEGEELHKENAIYGLPFRPMIGDILFINDVAPNVTYEVVKVGYYPGEKQEKGYKLIAYPIHVTVRRLI
jgi:hypothetical protein